jgi:uncharacterized protein (DUF1800 family)
LASRHFDGDDVLDMLLRKPQTARFVTLKLWKYLVSPRRTRRHPAPVRAVLPRQLRNPPAAALMLLTPAFWNSQGQLVKSPVELTVGTLVTFDLTRRTGAHWPGLTASWVRTCSTRPMSKAGPVAILDQQHHPAHANSFSTA